MNMKSVTLVHQSEQRNIEIAASLTVKLDLKRSPLKTAGKWLLLVKLLHTLTSWVRGKVAREMSLLSSI